MTLDDGYVTDFDATVSSGGMDDRERDRLQLAAAWSPVVLGGVALVLMPLVYPGLGAYRWVFGVYVGLSLLGQLFIWKGIGGMPRAVLGGVVDMAVLTFLVHRIGSTATMMVSVYFFAAILNTLVVGRRVGVSLALCGAALYSMVVVAEANGWIPYGPDSPSFAGNAPSRVEAAVTTGLLSTLLVLSAAVVGLLVSRIRTREAELLAANTKLEELSLRDPLTQLFNRRHLMARLEDELARVRRGAELAVVMIDLDRFKRVNDLRGHQAGDEVLKQIAHALAGATREVDVPGRYGGDEFVVILPDTDSVAAMPVARRLAEAVRAVGEAFDAEQPVTASVGVATARADDDARGLIQRADENAYRAKKSGGDRVSLAPVIGTSGEWDAPVSTGVRPKTG